MYAGKLFFRDELQGHAVVAKARPCGGRTVVEDMPMMPTALGAVVFGTRHEELEVAAGFEHPWQGGEKAWPARAAVVFHVAAKERRAATCAHIGALALFIIERAGAWRLGAFMPEHGIGLGVEFGAPLGVGFFDLIGHVLSLWCQSQHRVRSASAGGALHMGKLGHLAPNGGAGFKGGGIGVFAVATQRLVA